MSDEKKVSVDSILKNALQWKQWMADDLRILLNVSRNDNLSDKALHQLITHHLKTYTLVNQSFGYMIDSPETELFELPNLDYLKEILPSLDLTESNVEKVIEPMLELELDGLSRELRDETLKPKEEEEEAVEVLHDEDESEDVFVDEDNLDLHDEHDFTDDVLEYEDVDVDDVVDTQEIEMDNDLITSDAEQDDDTYVEDEVHELDVDDDIDDIEEDDEDDLPIPKIVDIPESKVETKDLIGELWDSMVMDDEKLGLNKGDANIGDGN